MLIMDEGNSLLQQMPPMKSMSPKANRIVEQRLSMLERLKLLNKDNSSQLLLPTPPTTHFYPMVIPLHQQYNIPFLTIDAELIKMVSHQQLWETLFSQIVRGKRKRTGGLFLGNARFMDPKGIVREGETHE